MNEITHKPSVSDNAEIRSQATDSGSNTKQEGFTPEIPEKKRSEKADKPGGGSKTQPELDDTHVHEVQPVKFDDDFGDKGEGTQNNGSAGF